MTTDRDLDALLTAAAGVRDADLPALPDSFLATLRTDADEPASVLAARQLVADARDARTTPGRRRPSRKVLVRVGAGVLVIAAAWTTAVVVDTPGEPRPPVATPVPATVEPTPLPLDPPGGLTLVAADAITFPYSLEPAPEELTPILVRTGGLEMFGVVEPVAYSARYSSAEELGFTFVISPQDPRIPPPGAELAPRYDQDEIDEQGTVPVDGQPAEFVAATLAEPDCDAVPVAPGSEEAVEVCSDRYAELSWQRPDGLWVGLMGQGDRYGEVAALVAVAESIVDRPQPVQLQFRLAPVGWQVSGYESLSTLTLADAADPTNLIERIAVSVLGPDSGEPADVLQGETEGGPVEAVTVNGRPGALVSVPERFADLGSGKRMWILVAEFPDGVRFYFQAPDTLTREDVLAMAEGMTYTP